MEKIPSRSVFDVVTDFLTSDPSPEKIINYHLPDDLQARAHHLLDRNGEGKLSFAEQQEMYDLMRIDQMMSMLKAKTQLKLQDSE